MSEQYTVNRDELLTRLQAVQAGLASRREVIEQSSCFIFQNKYVLTYNDEVACRHKSGLPKDFSGAVRSAPLLAILQKLPEETITLEPRDEELRIVGTKKVSGVGMEKEILLAVEAVDQPGEWTDLHADFQEALEMVAQSAGKDESKFSLTCVHCHPKYLESGDNMQFIRYRLKTRFSQEFLVRQTAIKNIIAFGMTQFSETESWVHFKNPSGLIMSCRRHIENFPDISDLLEVNGDKASFPKGLVESIDRAEVFSTENSNENYVKIDLKPGKMKLRGEGVSGWHTEVVSMPSYKGDAKTFFMSPGLLRELTKKHNECIIGKNSLQVKGERFTYVAYLGQPEENDGDSE